MKTTVDRSKSPFTHVEFNERFSTFIKLEEIVNKFCDDINEEVFRD